VKLIKKVYGNDPFICSNRGCEMKIIAVIFSPDEIKRILSHLVKIGQVLTNYNSTSSVVKASCTLWDNGVARKRRQALT